MVALLSLLSLGACRGTLDVYDHAAGGQAEMIVAEVTPAVVSARGLEELRLRGAGLQRVIAVHIGDAAATILDVDEDTLYVLLPRLRAGSPSIVLTVDDGRDVYLDGRVEVLPLELSYEPAANPPYAVPDGLSARVAAAGDFDGDGDLDVVVAGDTADAAALLLNEAGILHDVRGGEPNRFPAPGGVEGVAVADLDGNGSLDLLFTTVADEPATLLLNDGSARFVAGPALPAALASATRVVAADFDRDGWGDIALADRAADTPAVQVLLNRTGSAGSPANLVPVDPATFAETGVIAADIIAADLDGDADPDLVLLHAQADHADGRPYTVVRNDGGTFAVAGPPTAPLEGPGPRRGVALDHHADGDLDLYLGCNAQDRLFENIAGQLADTTATTLPVDDARVGAVAAADLDRDGFPEVVVAAYGAQNRLYTPGADGRMRDQTPVLPIARAESVAVLLDDFDGDGADDIFFLPRSGPATLLHWRPGGSP